MVHKTKDYDKFGFNYLNREVDAIHVRRLIKDMETAGLRVPIIVDENMEVIDGQHRYPADAFALVGKGWYAAGGTG